MKSEEQIRCMFKFVCPNTWEQLQVTQDDGVRFCDECNHKVHWVVDENDLQEHARQGHCVAYQLPKNELPDNNGQIETIVLGNPIDIEYP